MFPGSKILQGIKAWRHSEELAETIRKRINQNEKFLNVDEVRTTLLFTEEMEDKFYLQPFVCGKHMKYMS